MTSGFGPWPGSSTTLRAAAWATRLHGPTTKSVRWCQRRLRGSGVRDPGSAEDVRGAAVFRGAGGSKMVGSGEACFLGRPLAGVGFGVAFGAGDGRTGAAPSSRTPDAEPRTPASAERAAR